MTWPENPQSPLDLPLELHSQVLIDTLEIPTPGTAAQLCEFVAYEKDKLDAITEGDEAKEKALGQILLILAYRSASYATPEELKNVRYEIGKMELGIDDAS